VPVILFLAAAAILACVVLAAMGMGGEMATFPSDSAPLRMDEVTAADVALLRPPLALWGYNVPATEEALGVIARAVTARDTEIATLRAELADMRARPCAGDGTGSSHNARPAQVAAGTAEVTRQGSVPAHVNAPPPRAPAPGPGDVSPTPHDISPTAHDEVPAWPVPPEPGPGE
jgi:hypothetical protein